MLFWLASFPPSFIYPCQPVKLITWRAGNWSINPLASFPLLTCYHVRAGPLGCGLGSIPRGLDYMIAVSPFLACLLLPRGAFPGVWGRLPRCPLWSCGLVITLALPVLHNGGLESFGELFLALPWLEFFYLLPSLFLTLHPHYKGSTCVCQGVNRTILGTFKNKSKIVQQPIKKEG